MAEYEARTESEDPVADQDNCFNLSKCGPPCTRTNTSLPGTSRQSCITTQNINTRTIEVDSQKERGGSSLFNICEKSNCPDITILNGSTLGGVDPLNRLIQEQDLEPTFWQQCREESRTSDPHPKKRFRPSMPDPKHYDTLPLSCEYYDREVTSGFDITIGPVSSEVFWAILKARWDLAMRRENVADQQRVLGTSRRSDEPKGSIHKKSRNLRQAGPIS